MPKLSLTRRLTRRPKASSSVQPPPCSACGNVVAVDAETRAKAKALRERAALGFLNNDPRAPLRGSSATSTQTNFRLGGVLFLLFPVLHHASRCAMSAPAVAL